jgi:hypothetical protein
MSLGSGYFTTSRKGNIFVKAKKKPRSIRYLAVMKRVLSFWL